MCLHTIDEETKDITIGWKVFSEEDNVLFPVFYIYELYINTKKLSYSFNEWITNKSNKKIEASLSRKKYKNGFHFYLNKENAIQWANEEHYINNNFVVKKILVKDLICTGTQNGYEVGVAKTILVLNE